MSLSIVSLPTELGASCDLAPEEKEWQPRS